MGVFDDLLLDPAPAPQDPIPVPASGGTFGDLPLAMMTPSDPGALQSFGLGIGDMMSLGAGDEYDAYRQAGGLGQLGIGGRLADLIPFIGAAKGVYDVEIAKDPAKRAAYEKQLHENRLELERAQKAHPVANFAGQVVGGIPAAVATRGAVGAPLTQQMLYNGLVGAGLGGAYGFNSSEGSLMNRVEAALPGAGWGFGIGAAVPAAAQIGSGIYNTLRGRVGTVPGFTRKAVDNIRMNVDADGGPNAIQQRMRDLGPDAMLGEAGPNLTMSAERIAKTPGSGSKILNDAVDERALRLDGGAMQQRVDQVIGSQSTRTQVADVLQGVRDQASPLYEQVKSMKGQFDTRGLAKALDAQIKGSDGAIADMLEKVKGLKVFSGKGPANIEQLHAAREALDVMITQGFKDGNAKGAIAAKTYRNAIDKALKQFPDFAQADAMWSAQVRGGKAFDAGLSIFEKGGDHPIHGSPDQFAKWWAKAKPEEKDALRVGIRNAYDKLMGTKSAPMSNMPEVAEAQAQTRAVASELSKPWTQQKLRIALGDNEFNHLKNLSDAAQTAQNFRQTIKGGSRTMMGEEAKKMWPGATGDAGWSAGLGQRSLWGTGMELLAKGANAVGGGFINRGRDAALRDGASILTQKEADAMRFLKALENMNGVQAQARAVGGLLDVLPFKNLGGPVGTSAVLEQQRRQRKQRQ